MMDPLLSEGREEGAARVGSKGGPARMGLDDAFSELGWGDDAWCGGPLRPAVPAVKCLRRFVRRRLALAFVQRADTSVSADRWQAMRAGSAREIQGVHAAVPPRQSAGRP